MLANINPSGMDIDYNIQRLKTIVEIAAQNRVNVLVLPELPVSGYVWDPENENKEEILLIFYNLILLRKTTCLNKK